MRRIPIVLASASAALAAGAVLAVSGGAQAPQGRTISLVSKGGDFKFVDVPPRAKGEEDARPGDQFLISVPLFTPANKRAGTLDARCSFTRGGRALRGTCDGVYTLADGELYLQARLTADDDTSGAITGGTGAYVGARGTFTSKDRPGEANGDPSDDVITLLP